MTKHGEPLAHFYVHVDDNTDECIVWPYGATGGYGRLHLPDHSRPMVHVLACERHYGPMPQPGMIAMHAPVICHNSLCYNWRHLSWGTKKLNSDDKTLDGTKPFGETHGQSKLTWEKVAQIRQRYAAGGITLLALATEYGVNKNSVWHVVHRLTWTGATS
jgi:hypothetical protein